MKVLPPVLCSALALPDGDGAPDWLHLLPAGLVRTIDGRGPYRVGDVQQLMATSIAGGKLPLDENHATDLAAPKGGSAPARGWIVELQNRADGIWGKVDWTGPGRRMAEDKEYRGVSPVIAHDRDGVITAILRASLTNTPNLAGLTALHSQEGNSMDLLARLIEALGLDAGADGDAVVTAIKKLKDAGSGQAVATALQSALAPIGAIIGLQSTADAAAVLAGVQQLKAGAGDGAAIVALQAELTDVTNRLNAAVDNQARDKAVAFVDGAIGAGRVGVKPVRDEYVAMHMADPARAEKLVNAMPVLKAGATVVGDPPKGADGLDAEDRKLIQLMGLDPAAYAAAHAEIRQEAL